MNVSYPTKRERKHIIDTKKTKPNRVHPTILSPPLPASKSEASGRFRVVFYFQPRWKWSEVTKKKQKKCISLVFINPPNNLLMRCLSQKGNLGFFKHPKFIQLLVDVKTNTHSPPETSVIWVETAGHMTYEWRLWLSGWVV